MLDWLGVLIVAVTAFLDAAVFPISVQALLVGVALAYPQWAWGLVAVYAIASGLGSCVGYGLGCSRLAVPLIRRFPTEKWEQAETTIRRYGPLIVATGGMTPIPFPLFTIAAGMFRMSLPTLLMAVLIGRGAKAVFFVVASAYLGQRALEQFVKDYSPLIIGAALLLTVLGTWWGWRSWKSSRDMVKRGIGETGKRRDGELEGNGEVYG